MCNALSDRCAHLLFEVKSMVCKKSDFPTLNVHLISPAGRWKFHFDSRPKLVCHNMFATLLISDSALLEIYAFPTGVNISQRK